MEKRKKIVLSIGFALILITCIVHVVLFIHENTIEPVGFFDKRINVPFYFIFVFPIIPEEFLLLISVYQLICYSPKIPAKICHIISIVVLCVALVFQLLVFTGVITDDIMPNGPTAASSRFAGLILLTEWPVIFLSIILESVKSGIKFRPNNID